MIRVRFEGGTNYCGTDEDAIFEYPDGTSLDEMEEDANHWMMENIGVWSTVEVLDDDEEEEE